MYFTVVAVVGFRDRDKGGSRSSAGGMCSWDGRCASGLRARAIAVSGDLLDGAAAASQRLTRSGSSGSCVTESVRSHQKPQQQCSASVPAGQSVTISLDLTALFMRDVNGGALDIDAKLLEIFLKVLLWIG